MTVMIGETVQFNCTGIQEHLVAVWIIDEHPHDWTDFIPASTCTFNLLDNSLTVNNSPKSLDGTSFQCVLNGHTSTIGYLTLVGTPTEESSQSVFPHICSESYR